MKEYIQSSSASFVEFLNQNRNLLKSRQGQTLVSFVFLAEKIELQKKLDSLCKSQEVFFYSEKPSGKKILFGINSILTIAEKGGKRFPSLEKKVTSLKEQFISNQRDFNFEIPLLLGSMKFAIEHPDNDWKDFNDSHWFVPELLYMNNEEEYYLVYNVFVSPKINTEIIVPKFENALKQFLHLPVREESKELRLLNKSGNEPKDKKKWKNQVNQALDKIEDGEIQKIVLSRKVELIFTADILIEPILKSLIENYPECTLFIFHNGKSSFVGASPETLAKFQNNKMQIEILAGSAERGSDKTNDIKMENELLLNEKELNEHKFVVNYVIDSLQKSVETIDISQPSVKKLKNIQHLRSTINLNLNENNSFINLIGKIHPTPAVCGVPADTALNLIKKIENHQRGLYAGLIGWLNLRDEGEFVLAIRSALAVGNKLIAFAGCGIVKGSNPDTEFKETDLKLKPFLSIFNNEN